MKSVPIQGFLLFALLVAALVTSGCGGGGIKSADVSDALAPPFFEIPREKIKCNMHEELCDRRYDRVTYAGTHNSMSNRDEGWSFANQIHGIARQLEDGIRLINLDAHYNGGEPYLCHGYCEAGSEPLSSGLLKIRNFLYGNPNEVVTIIFESYISSGDIQAEFDKTGLLDHTYSHGEGKQWPTLRDMIRDGERLVVFTDSGGGDYSWYHPVWNYTWETKYSYKTADDFECGPNRGNPGNDLYLINHFISDPLPNFYKAEVVNANPLFIDRVRECVTEKNTKPNFILVDFYSTGDLFEVVDTLNQIDSS